MAEPSTPLMRQYHAVKQQVPHALLMFRLGDFYELFYEDAVTAARELEITLTARNKEHGEPVPMCGVPFHAAEGYIAKLVQKGYRVALCDQMEEAGPGKKLVRRELTRVITPGTATAASLVRAGENNFLAAVTVDAGRAGVALADLSTGEFRVTEMALPELPGLLESFAPREILAAAGAPPVAAALTTTLEPWIFEADYADRTLRDHFRLMTLDGCGLAGRPLAAGAAGAALHYLRETQKAALDHLDRPSWFDRAGVMILDPVTVRNLELVEPMFAEDKGSREATLLAVIDRTATGMGARLLRRRLLQPSMDRAEIESRLDAVEELARSTVERARVVEALRRILDLERLLARVTIGTAGPREMLALGRSLAVLPELRAALAPFHAPRLAALAAEMEELPAVREAILASLADQPPADIAAGGTIRAGRSAELDELRALQTNSKQFLAAIETRERERTGIASLKVRFNNIFGYYIEVSKANLAHVPRDYDRKQTLVNAERFTTPELKELETKILEAESKILEIERRLYEEIRQTVIASAAEIRRAAAQVAETDVLASLATVAAERRYTRPRFSVDGTLRIEAGRHPVIEALLEREAQRFTPNDLYLDSKKFLAILTGPNMGGKSTYLRQAALIAILAQAGSFVPASAATLPLMDRVFTRIGASDNLSRGRSTFMVEMTETALILNTATENSLIILDEIGRGTSTYDGLAIAWAVAEYIHQRIRARTLFATHYHELTALAEKLGGVVNLRVTVEEAGDKILFLRKVEPGAADKSYGIEVARLAALPEAVVERAREVLAVHERTERLASDTAAPPTGPVQIKLFEPVNGQLAARIRAVDINQLRPLEALQLLAALQQELQ
jgi:DNA mismatch repair protein MutS